MCADVFIDPGRFGNVYWCGDRYSYHLNKVHRHPDGSSTLYLRCINFGYMHCVGKAQILEHGAEATWLNTARHDCNGDHLAHLERMLVADLLRACREDPYQDARNLLNRIAVRYPVEVAARVRLARIRSSMRRARQQQYPNIPPKLYDLGVLLSDVAHQQLTSTLDSRDNLYAGTVGGPGSTSIVFLSYRMKRFLRNVRRVYVDGTFVPVPSHPVAHQVYQIVTLVRNNVIPIVQVIMESRTRDAYKAVLSHLKAIAPEFKPQEVMMDFERAEYVAWEEEYGDDARITCCYVHFVRAALRNSRSLGLTRLLRADVRLYRIVRCLLAIPLLPQHLMRRGFRVVVRIAMRYGMLRGPGPLDDFLKYFTRSWMTGWRFFGLSVFNVRHRTNNACESANRLLRLETGLHHPSVWNFLNAIRNYEQSAFTDQVTFRRGLNIGLKRRTSVLLNDRAIRNFTSDLRDGNISLKRFLLCTSGRVTRLLNENL